MTTYRQALRDLPTHDNWPNLGDDDWPTKPGVRYTLEDTQYE